MRGYRIGSSTGLDRLEICDLPDPGAPGRGEIRVNIKATSLNYHDYRISTGEAVTAIGRTPMADGAGIVEAVGEGVDAFSCGDHVVSLFFPNWLNGDAHISNFDFTPGDGIDGYACETVVRPAAHFTLAPKGYSHAEAATLPTAGLTAWRSLVSLGRVKSGDTVLVMGTGGVSIFALQIAKAAGARVLATSSSDEKLRRLESMGAEQLVNYRTTPAWGRAIAKMTGGVGVDHIVEIGGSATLAQSLEALRVGGNLALVGALTGRSGNLPLASMIVRQIRANGVVVGSRHEQLMMIKGFESTGVRPIIDRNFGFEDLQSAFSYQISGTHFGKICVNVG